MEKFWVWFDLFKALGRPKDCPTDARLHPECPYCLATIILFTWLADNAERQA